MIRIFSDTHGPHRYFCLFAAVIAVCLGILPPENPIPDFGKSGIPCYGIASGSADAACVLTTRSDQEPLPALVRSPFESPRTTDAAGPLSLTFRLLSSGVGTPPGIPPVTAHHLRV